MGQGTPGNPNEHELWGVAYRRLVGWTVRRHGLDPTDAQDVVQGGIEQYLEAGGTAHGGLDELLRGIGSRINGIVVNLRRKKALKAVGLTKDGLAPEHGDEGREEERLLDDDWAHKAIGLLVDRLSDDEVLFEMLCKMEDGLETPAELSEALGVDVRAVYKARRRLKGHAEAVRAQMEGS